MFKSEARGWPDEALIKYPRFYLSSIIRDSSDRPCRILEAQLRQPRRDNVPEAIKFSNRYSIEAFQRLNISSDRDSSTLE
jgi:hypothetical protein